MRKRRILEPATKLSAKRRKAIQRAVASVIEARRVETENTGSIEDESAVRDSGDAR